jgi:hypothetical protein
MPRDRFARQPVKLLRAFHAGAREA